MTRRTRERSASANAQSTPLGHDVTSDSDEEELYDAIDAELHFTDDETYNLASVDEGSEDSDDGSEDLDETSVRDVRDMRDMDSGWGENLRDPVVRPPFSLEDCVVQYVNNIKPRLMEFLRGETDNYFVALVMLKANGEHDVPAIVIMSDEQCASEIPDVERFPREILDSDYVFVIGKGKYCAYSPIGERTPNLGYHNPMRSGCSIGAGPVKGGTAGLFLNDNQDNSHYGITCAHVLTENDIHTYQPCVLDFFDRYTEVKAARRAVYTEYRRAVGDAEKAVFAAEIRQLGQEWNLLKSLKAYQDSETMKRLEVGKGMRRELKVVQYNNRKCVADWAIFQVNARNAIEREWYGSPRGGYLGSLQWAAAGRIEEMSFDKAVRKSGRTTGLTYGYVAGLHANFLHPDIGSEGTDEFYVIHEETVFNQRFADQGDSGSAVIDNEGNAIGVLFGGWELIGIKVVLDNRMKINIEHLQNYRQADGSWDIVGYVTGRLLGLPFILVQSLKMILQRSGVDAAFVKDC
jgi:hypothetical protein